MTSGRPSTIYDWLEEVEAHPFMWFARLRDLECLIHGYGTALAVHCVDEGVPDIAKFSQWLRARTRWSMACGWAAAITEHVHPEERAAKRFFKLVREYRALRPTCQCLVDLGPRNEPTGKKVRYRDSARVERPDRVEVVRYVPSSVYVLRFRYRDRVQTRHLSETTLRNAKAWVAAEFQVEPDDWKDARSRTRRTPTRSAGRR
jgi:hypothetical protein